MLPLFAHGFGDVVAHFLVDVPQRFLVVAIELTTDAFATTKTVEYSFGSKVRWSYHRFVSIAAELLFVIGRLAMHLFFDDTNRLLEERIIEIQVIDAIALLFQRTGNQLFLPVVFDVGKA